MFRKPWFWIAFVVVTALCVVYSVAYFSKGFPLVTVSTIRCRASSSWRREARKPSAGC
jgi:hypothetical protein